MKYDRAKSTPKNRRETRALLGSRFKVLLADLGLSHDDAAKLLHVTPRTIKYWVSGAVLVPYAAYKLVRVMRLFELPCAGWEGWHMHSGRLWSPEGHGFVPTDSSWWGLLVRKARLFGVLYERDRQLAGLFARMGAGSELAQAVPGAGEARPVGGVSARPTDTVGRAA